MPAIPSLGRIEAALQGLLERPFLRRAPLDLPLLKTKLRRAMADELKPVSPSRFVLAVSAQQLRDLEPQREVWEAQLAQYFEELVRENGWSAVTAPRVEIVADPELQGNEVMVSVDESYLVHHGRTLRRIRRRGGLIPLLASTGAMLACLYLAVLLVVPGLMPAWVPMPRVPSGQISLPAPSLPSVRPILTGWWDGARQAVSRAVGEGVKSAGRALPTRVSGEVAVSPGLTVRAGSPDRSGGAIDGPGGFLPTGTTVQWWSFQVARGEPIGGEDRWVMIGRAGAEWGEYAGQDLYVWMGGLRVK